MIKIKRPVLIFTIGFLIGIIYGLYFKTSIAFTFGIAFIIHKLFLICRGGPCVRPHKIFRYLKVILNYKIIIIFCLSAIISNIYLIYSNNKYENIYKSGISKINARGVIISEKTEKEYTYSYVIKIKHGNLKNKKFIIYVKKDSGNILKYGDLIGFEGDYIVPTKARNYKGFDYGNYLKSKKIYGTIKISNYKILKSKELNKILLKSNDIRKSIIDKSNKLLPKETSKLFLGIAIGSKEGLSQEIIDNFKKSNLSHILAVSGAHTSYIILRYNVYFNLYQNIKKRDLYKHNNGTNSIYVYNEFYSICN